MTNAELLETLGLGEIEIVGDETEDRRDRDDDPWSWRSTRESRAQRPTEAREFVSGDGERLTLALAVGSLLAIDGGDAELRPVLQRHGAAEGVDVLAASFLRGEGEIVVVADPDLFANARLGEQDNSVAAVRLLSPEGGPVVFDEHYHGLSVRGNALFLLTKPGFAAVTLALVAATGVWAWRTAIPLGPPVVTPPKPRRDLREYVDAMARLLLRGSDGRRYLLGEVRQGTLEELGRQLSLAVLTPEPAKVAAALSRRDRSRAETFTTTIDAIDRRLVQKGRLGVAETTELMQRAARCL